MENAGLWRLFTRSSLVLCCFLPTPSILNVFLEKSYKVSNWRKIFWSRQCCFKNSSYYCKRFTKKLANGNIPKWHYFQEVFFLTVFWISEIFRDLGFSSHLLGWRKGLLANVYQPRDEGVLWSDPFHSESTHQPPDKEVLSRLFTAGKMK